MRLLRISFGLRSLLALIALCAVGCWLGISIHRIAERRAVLDGTHGYYVDYSSVDSGPSAPRLLWLFGERGYIHITLHFGGTPGEPLNAAQQHELERVKRLYPECKSIEWDLNPGIGPLRN